MTTSTAQVLCGVLLLCHRFNQVVDEPRLFNRVEHIRPSGVAALLGRGESPRCSHLANQLPNLCIHVMFLQVLV